VEFTYNFGRRSLFGTTAIRPYLVAGGGGITTNLKNGDVFVLNNRFIAVPGVAPATLRAAELNGTLQNILPGVNTTDGVVFVGTPTGSTVVVANDVLRNQTFQISFLRTVTKCGFVRSTVPRRSGRLRFRRRHQLP
jgi:hypothetical protein